MNSFNTISRRCCVKYAKQLNNSKILNRFVFYSSKLYQERQSVHLRERYRTRRDVPNADDYKTNADNYKKSIRKKPIIKKDKQSIKKNSPSVIVTEENQYQVLNDLITPLWKLSYKEQLDVKYQWSKYVFNQFCTNADRYECNIDKTIPSPVINGYRNKSELSIRKGIDGNMKTVGCFIGATGVDPKNVICVSPKHLINTPEKHKQITQLYQDFIRSSPLPALHDLFDGGFWKGLIIRTNNITNDTMVVSIVHPQQFTEEEIDEQAKKLKHFFEKNNADITSLYHQSCPHTRCSNEVAPYKLLSGEPYLNESLLGYKFRISPDSFFQINKPAAELLYSKLIELAQFKPNTVLLDLCCGTGAISILCSNHVRSCVGIDVMAQAIADAKSNSYLNNVSNCNFIEGKIERTLSKVLEMLDNSSDIVAVLNPTRNGVEPGIIKAIRYCRQITKLIYVSCKGDTPSTLKNFKDLCNPKLCTGKPFRIKNITPVDMFPHTNHCELILLFER